MSRSGPTRGAFVINAAVRREVCEGFGYEAA